MLVFVNDVLGKPDVPSNHPAHEAWLRSEAAVHSLHVRMVAFETFFQYAFSLGCAQPVALSDSTSRMPVGVMRNIPTMPVPVVPVVRIRPSPLRYLDGEEKAL